MVTFISDGQKVVVGRRQTMRSYRLLVVGGVVVRTSCFFWPRLTVTVTELKGCCTAATFCSTVVCREVLGTLVLH